MIVLKIYVTSGLTHFAVGDSKQDLRACQAPPSRAFLGAQGRQRRPVPKSTDPELKLKQWSALFAVLHLLGAIRSTGRTGRHMVDDRSCFLLMIAGVLRSPITA